MDHDPGVIHDFDLGVFWIIFLIHDSDPSTWHDPMISNPMRFDSMGQSSPSSSFSNTDSSQLDGSKMRGQNEDNSNQKRITEFFVASIRKECEEAKENEDEEKSEEIEFLTFTHSNFLTFTRDPKRVNLRVKGAGWGS